MATLRAAVVLRKSLQPFQVKRAVSSTSVLANWNKDWKPGPFPKTAEERAAAAKRYGLRVEDYDVYKDDGMGYGDYPKLPYASGDSRDPYEDWDIPELKRNFGQPLHSVEDTIGEDRWDANANPRYSYAEMFLTLGAFLGTLITVYVLTLDYPMFLPAMPKQLPGHGQGKGDETKHYTFEPAE